MEIEQGTSCMLYTFNEYELKQHDIEIRADEKNKVAKEVEELKEKLENAIIPKFKSGSTLYHIEDDYFICEKRNSVAIIFNDKIYYGSEIENEYDLINYGLPQVLIPENQLYETRQEAELALKELKGESENGN